MQVTEAPFVDKRGAQRTWQELHMQLQRLLRKRFPDVDRDILSDAVSDAVLDLMGRWSRLDSSHANDTQWRFGYALQRGMYTAAAVVRGACRSPEVPYAFGIGPSNTANEDVAGVLEPGFAENRFGYYQDFADPAPLPDEVVCEDDDIERARKMLADLPAEELADFFELLASGESVRTLAARLNVPKSTVSDRQLVAREHVRNAARKYGLVPA